MHRALLKLDIVEIICDILDISSLCNFYESCRNIKEAIDKLGLWRRRAHKIAGSSVPLGYGYSSGSDWLIKNSLKTADAINNTEYFKNICVAHNRYMKIRTSSNTCETAIQPEGGQVVNNCAVSESYLLVSVHSESEPILNLWNLSSKRCVPLRLITKPYKDEKIWSVDLQNKFAVSGSHEGKFYSLGLKRFLKKYTEGNIVQA